MGTYQYKARDKFSKLVQGVMGADSEGTVALRLKQMGYAPVSIGKAQEEIKVNRIFDRFRSVGFSDLNMFTRQFATLQKAGLPLLSALGALKEQASNRILKDAIGEIARDIEGGSSLSAAIGRHPRIFNPLYINMISTGETSGRLDETLERLATLGEHEEKIRLSIRAASRYPMIVVAGIIIGFFILTTFVVPRFAKVYAQFNTALPLPTRILIWLNYAITNFWWLLLVIVAVFVFLLNRLIHTKSGRFFWDNLKLKLPIFGPLMLKLIMSRFSRITGTLMHSGVPILQILKLASDGVGNVVISRTIDNIRMSVSEGKGMSGPIKTSGMFPPAVVQMIAVGEETGKVDELLLRVSDYYDSLIDYTLSNLVSLIEPALTFLLGCVVLFMALAIFLPMWNLMSLFRR